MDENIIADNLVKLRQAKNWTQEDLSNKLHVSRQAISKWETGLSVPNIDTLLELSKLYKISINEILEPPKSDVITCFEDISKVEFFRLKEVLIQINKVDIVKASMATSPQINELLRNLFKDIDFNEMRTIIGSVRISEIEDIHNRIVNMLNT
jgi:transcriptional regulator with XRE-family HTH domain